ncbi:N-acetylated-alpha-linked acidic dipeptidase 2-like [Anneissia japonica]|uniref:N-acetylated-alpha-linked acidic dipeptidase 2-like n=1 Tax=Anneissia japonica TaxID=1529436 RepID=UPI001425A490|nr:N-acetylated-alpha-linked acidic dipeptidase 2-like [Anneissia japonica]
MNRRQVVVIAVVAVVVVLGIGIGIGVLIERERAVNPEARQADEAMSDRIMNEINLDNIRTNLKTLTAKPHVAGTAADLSGAEFIQQTWLDQGLDIVNILPYNVLLQHPPPPTSPDRNKVEIYNPSDPSNPLFVSAALEDAFGEEDLLQDDIMPPYFAYSAAGDIHGDLVYVNYCSMNDLEYVNNTLGIILQDKILIAKFSRLGRAKKAYNAEYYGAKGLIIYPDPDPEDHYFNEKPYPDGIFMPSSGTSRGSLLIKTGDPLTPGYPAKEYAYRLKPEEVGLPKILVYPIGFGDAEQLLSKMKGKEKPTWWSGGLNITYKIGPGFAAPYNNFRVRILINSKLIRKWTYNVVGYIRGEVEPDRYVLIGNHRDSWVLGSVDAKSGTACLLEISRVFGKLKKEGWRPRRTLIFGSWGAEEFAIIGSTEYTEEFYMNLVERAVVYLNLDIAVAGDYVLMPSASPHLVELVLEASKKVPDPRPSTSRKTLYDTMKARNPENYSNPESLPYVPMVSPGSDHQAFMYDVGVSCISAFYFMNFNEVWQSFYPLYHTSYETFRLMDEIIDPGFKTHLAVAQFFAEMLRRLSDEYILPMNVELYADYIHSQLQQFAYYSPPNITEKLADHGMTLDFLQDAISNFSSAAAHFRDSLAKIDKAKVLDVRRINDQMMLLDRAFMNREELPRLKDRQGIQRNVLFSSIGLGPFPGLLAALQLKDEEQRWRSVEKQLAVLTNSIQSAATTLVDVTSW